MRLGYARVSTTDQTAAMQVKELLEVGRTRTRSSSTRCPGPRAARERPAMKEFLSYARKGDEVFVWWIDRLGRSLVDVVNTVNEIRTKGIDIHSIKDGVDPSTPQGRLQLALFASSSGQRTRVI